MSSIETKVVDRLVARVVAACAPREIILFGSYAKGLADRHSDIDLLVILDGPVSTTLENAAFDATRTAIRVDVHLHNVADLNALTCDPHSFLSSILWSSRTVYCRPGIAPIGRSGPHVASQLPQV